MSGLVPVAECPFKTTGLTVHNKSMFWFKPLRVEFLAVGLVVG